MIASFLAALKAIPEVVGLIKELVSAVRAMQAAYQKAQEEKFIERGREIAKQLGQAKTDEERRKLLDRLSDNWNSMPGA